MTLHVLIDIGGLRVHHQILAWWCRPVIPPLVRLRKEALKFKASRDYTGRPYLTQKKIVH
jgi:hypothetical protein